MSGAARSIVVSPGKVGLDDLARVLAGLIREGRYKPDEALPSERVLAGYAMANIDFGVASPIRFIASRKSSRSSAMSMALRLMPRRARLPATYPYTTKRKSSAESKTTVSSRNSPRKSTKVWME